MPINYSSLFLRQAERDLRLARLLLFSHKFPVKPLHFPEWAIYGCQQAAEKALKAVVYEKNPRFFHYGRSGRTHDFSVLKRALYGANLLLPPELDQKLRLFYGLQERTRYPDVSGRLPEELYSFAKTKECYEVAEQVFLWAKRTL